jgi:hypothetical protein
MADYAFGFNPPYELTDSGALRREAEVLRAEIDTLLGNIQAA